MKRQYSDLGAIDLFFGALRVVVMAAAAVWTVLAELDEPSRRSLVYCLGVSATFGVAFYAALLRKWGVSFPHRQSLALPRYRSPNVPGEAPNGMVRASAGDVAGGDEPGIARAASLGPVGLAWS